MKRTKKMLALVLATSMVMGSSVVSFAASNPVNGTTKTGTVSGNGVSEGHVDKKVLNVVLPTVAEGDSAFQYTMDPERLIQATGGAKYEDLIFPAEEADTGVYFLVGDKTFANTSTEYQIINKSSCDVKLTVEVKTEATGDGSTDIALNSNGKGTVSTNNASAELYLGLKVGSSEEGVSNSATGTITKVLAGNPDNFTVAVKEENGVKNYVYQPKAEITPWKAMNISMTGEASKFDIDSTTTAPKVIVTWKWDEAVAADGDPSNDAVDAAGGPQVSLTSDGVLTMSGLTAEKNYAHSAILEYNGMSYELDTDPNMEWVTSGWSTTDGGTLIFKLSSAWLRALSGNAATITVPLSDGSSISTSHSF